MSVSVCFLVPYALTICCRGNGAGNKTLPESKKQVYEAERWYGQEEAGKLLAGCGFERAADDNGLAAGEGGVRCRRGNRFAHVGCGGKRADLFAPLAGKPRRFALQQFGVKRS